MNKNLKILSDSDKDSAQAIIDIGYPQNKKSILELLTWTYNLETPVSKVLLDFLCEIEAEKPQILCFLIYIDAVWRENLLNALVHKNWFNDLPPELKPTGKALLDWHANLEAKDRYINLDVWDFINFFPNAIKFNRNAFTFSKGIPLSEKSKADIKIAALKNAQFDHQLQVAIIDLVNNIHQIKDSTPFAQKFQLANDFIDKTSHLYLLCDRHPVWLTFKDEINEIIQFLETTYVKKLEEQVKNPVEKDKWLDVCSKRLAIKSFNIFFYECLEKTIDTSTLDQLMSKQAKDPINITETRDRLTGETMEIGSPLSRNQKDKRDLLIQTVNKTLQQQSSSEIKALIDKIGALYLDHYQYYFDETISILIDNRANIEQFISTHILPYTTELETVFQTCFNPNDWEHYCKMRDNIEAIKMLFTESHHINTKNLDNLIKTRKNDINNPSVRPENIPGTHCWWF